MNDDNVSRTILQEVSQEDNDYYDNNDRDDSNGDIATYESTLETADEKRVYLIRLYETVQGTTFNTETLQTIGAIVRNKIVRNVKFLDNEHISGLSNEGIERIRRYPSFWKPDLTKQVSIPMDIFAEFPDMATSTLHEKAQAWIGMRDKVIQSIRSHRNAIQTAIQNSIVEGRLNFYFYLI